MRQFQVFNTPKVRLNHTTKENALVSEDGATGKGGIDPMEGVSEPPSLWLLPPESWQASAGSRLAPASISDETLENKGRK